MACGLDALHATAPVASASHNNSYTRKYDQAALKQGMGQYVTCARPLGARNCCCSACGLPSLVLAPYPVRPFAGMPTCLGNLTLGNLGTSTMPRLSNVLCGRTCMLHHFSSPDLFPP